MINFQARSDRQCIPFGSCYLSCRRYQRRFPILSLVVADSSWTISVKSLNRSRSVAINYFIVISLSHDDTIVDTTHSAREQ